MVVDDPGEAARLARAGCDVVVVVPEGERAPVVDGPGRVAFFVGRPADPADRAAADAMDAELFGASQA